MEDDQQFCLRWNNHQSTLIQNFDTLLESGTLVDCTLAAEGKYLKAHKVVLSACSPYFEGLLSEHYDKHPVFILKDVKFKELKAMMDYMYRGEVNISQDQLTALLKAAESLQIKGLSDSRTGGGAAGGSATSSSKTETRSAKAASSTAATSSSLDIPHASSGLTIEKNSKVPRQSLQQVSVSDLPEDSASPQLRGLSSREGSQSPTSRKRLRKRKRSVNNDDTNSMENHEASNSSDVNISAPALGVAPVATEEKSHADPAETIGRSALMQQLTKPADEMLQIPIEKPEPSEEMIQPKSEYLDDQDDVEDLTNLDDDMNDLNEMEQDNSRAGPSHDPSQHGGIASWHISGDRSNASVVGAAAGPPGQQDEVFLAAHEAAQAQRDSQDEGILADCTNFDDEVRSFLSDPKMNIMGQSLFRKNNILGNITNHPLKNNRNADDFLNSDAPSALTTTHLTVEMTLRKKTLKTEDENVLKQKITTSPCKAKSNGLRKKCLEKLQGSYEIMRLYCPKCIKDLPITDTVYVNHELQNCKICNSRITYGCNKCNKMFKSRRTVKEHMLLICGKSPNLQCAHCTYKTFWKKDLKNHLFKKHGFVRNMNVHPPRKYYDGKIQFHCPKCKIELTSEETAHRRDSDLKYCNKCGTNILLTCKQCNRVYKRINSIKTHLHYYCEKSPGFKCQKCNYQSYRSFNFERHMIQHNTESGV